MVSARDVERHAGSDEAVEVLGCHRRGQSDDIGLFRR